MMMKATAITIVALICKQYSTINAFTHNFIYCSSSNTNRVIPLLSTTTKQEETNVNFNDWITDAPNEIIEWKKCKVEGTIPSYVKGTLIRNGGGIWTADDESYSHIFDGLAKIHAYRINDQEVEHQARFLKGKWYNEYAKKNKQSLPAGIGTGPVLDTNERPKGGISHTAKVMFDTVVNFDNTPVNIWDWTPHQDATKKRITAITDAPPRTEIDMNTMETSSSSTMNSFASGSKGYELLITAHPLYSQDKNKDDTSVDSYNVAVELGLNGICVNLVKETSEGDRAVVTSIKSEDGIPYTHSFGLSKNYAMIVLQPLRLNPAPDKQIELGFLRSMDHVDRTRVVLIDLATGKVVLDKSIGDKVYFYHMISQAEIVEDDDVVVSLRLCAYQTPDQLTGDHQFMRLEKCRKGRHMRNKLHKGGKFCDIICNAKDQSVKVEWNDETKQGFELPVTRYSRTFNGEVPPSDESNVLQAHPRYVYAFGAFALGSSDYDNWGLFKFDLKNNKIDSAYQQDSVYLSEPIFVANPNGDNEDDGVLLSQAYFGHEKETKLLVLDATDMMKVLAEIPTGHTAPLDFHGTWIPSSLS